MTDYAPQDDRDLPLNLTHCKAATPSFVKGRFFQCQRKAGVGGYCWQHQPERVAAMAVRARERVSPLVKVTAERDALLEVCERFVELKDMADLTGDHDGLYSDVVSLYDEAVAAVAMVRREPNDN